MRGLWHPMVKWFIRLALTEVIRFVDSVILQAIKGTLKRENLMGPCAGKTINDFQDDW